MRFEFGQDAPGQYAKACNPLCLVAMLAPNLYVNWRRKAHAKQRIRCDWLNRVG